jgi:hypothetical protein
MTDDSTISGDRMTERRGSRKDGNETWIYYARNYRY